MIRKVTGDIVHQASGVVVIEAGGVGYQIFVKQATLDEIAASKMTRVSLWTHMAVRENAMELYGFLHQETLQFFELLLTVSGIGPKTALAILNIAPVKTLESAIASGDPSHLTKTTGIGTKRAERIVLELKDKIELAEGEGSIHNDTSDIIEALRALGYSQKEARDVLAKLPKESVTAEEKIKQALKLIGK